jgi:bifunctional UDP-N-acetylglucosamine pyrophosphorylase / glucosamine-1-phosphate N-acetyltransferase
MSVYAVILAAGLGTRMKSATPKVLHTINGKPIISHVIAAAKSLRPEQIVAVISPGSNGIQAALKGDHDVSFAIQKEPKGTGDALKAATRKLAGKKGTVLVLCGDTPLVSPSTLQRLLATHKRKSEVISILSFVAGGDHSYGRIIKDGHKVISIVEDMDADPEQKNIKEVNSGIYAIESSALNLLKEIELNPGKGEYYLTDIVNIATRKGFRVGSHILGDETELTGINTRKDLCMAGLYLRDRVVSGWLEKGVSFVDIKSVFIDPDANIGRDTAIYPNVVIEGKSSIGNGCVIYPNTRIIDSTIGDGVTIKDSTVIESSIIRDGASIGPFAHLRPGSLIGVSAKIGNFVEIKKSVIGDGAKASHLSYLGDAEIGDKVNVGAGTITCNYDGVNKHKTVIEEGAFIGSDTQLVAPVKVGKGAYVGAGSTITKDVPPLALAVSRTPQRNLEGWAAGRSAKKSRKTSEG